MSKEIVLEKIAYARSGDKGSDVNIGVIAYKEEGFKVLLDLLTDDIVFSMFSGLHPKSVLRYAMPNIWALNFILQDVLEGGGSSCLRIDSQGKVLGQALLMKTLLIPEKYENMLTRAYGDEVWNES